MIKNSQRTYPIDVDLTRKHILKILDILQVPDFSVYLLFCSDAKMRSINKNLRLKSKSTDILSYALPDGAHDPLSGVKEGPTYLGTLVVCPAFVERQMLADQEAHEVLLVAVLTCACIVLVLCLYCLCLYCLCLYCLCLYCLCLYCACDCYISGSDSYIECDSECDIDIKYCSAVVFVKVVVVVLVSEVITFFGLRKVLESVC